MSRLLEEMNTMKNTIVLLAVAASSLLQLACAPSQTEPPLDEITAAEAPAPTLPRSISPDPRETHFSELTMLTDGGENAEAYFSFGSDKLIFQSTRESYGCDQIFTMNIDGSELQLASTGLGRTTCAYYYPNDDWILYASTHEGDPACPPTPDHSRGYVWPLYDTYDLSGLGNTNNQLIAPRDTPP